MTKKTNKTTTPKTAAPLLDGPHRKSTVADASLPWPHGKHAPQNGRVLVTPEMAREWLSANRSNRRIQRQAVDRVTRDLRDGRWKFNGQTATFSKAWRLMDGQHRLVAIAESGIAAEMLVWTGIDDDAMDTIDTNGAGTRSAADAWMIANDIQPTNFVKARVAASWAALRGDIPRTREEFGEAFGAFADGVSATAAKFAEHRRGLNRASIIAAFVIVWKAHPNETLALADQFVHGGAALSAGSPLLKLRDYAMQSEKAGGGTHRRVGETRNAISLLLDAVKGRERVRASHAGRASDYERMAELHGLAKPAEG